MSRLIPSHTLAQSVRNDMKIPGSKLILTTLRSRKLALLIQHDRLTMVNLPDPHFNRSGSIYLGKIKNYQKNIDAYFVEIAEKEIVYLPAGKCIRPFVTNRVYSGSLLEGDELLVQIERDAQKSKLAAVTTEICLTGRYAVVHTGGLKAGISSKLSKGNRELLVQSLQRNGFLDDAFRWLPQPKTGEISAIIRTEAADISEDALVAELEQLQIRLFSLLDKAKYSTCFCCLYSNFSEWESCINHFSGTGYEEAVTDDPSLYQECLPYFEKNGIPYRFYADNALSLSSLYSLESKLNDALSRRIWLKSGAYLIIDITEALTVIDVNSGKYDARKTSVETFRQINLEAAREIARQIRLRSLSGIILIDFINLHSKDAEDELLNTVKNLVSQDPVPTTVIDITPLGLMELTRKKINRTLQEQFSHTKDQEFHETEVTS